MVKEQSGTSTSKVEKKSGYVTNKVDGEQEEYRVYKRRWFVLLTLFMFNVANNIIWISFAAVSTKASPFLCYRQL